MHAALSVPLVVEGIYDRININSPDVFRHDRDPLSLATKYRLAGVCRLWREILGGHIFKQLYILVERRKGGGDSGEVGVRTASGIVDGQFVYRMNFDIIPNPRAARRLELHISKGDVITKEVVEYLTEHVFAGRNWPMVNELHVVTRSDFGMDTIDRAKFRQLEDVVRSMTLCTPNIGAVSIRSSNILGPPLDMMAMLGDTAKSITSLRLQYSDTIDYSQLVLPALQSLSVTTMHANNIRVLPVFDPETIRHIEFVAAYPDSVFSTFVRKAKEHKVIFPRLEVLDLVFVADISGQENVGRWDEYCFEFPRLRRLTIDPKKTAHCTVSKVFEHSPVLEVLSVKGNPQVLVGWDLTAYSRLHTVSASCDSFSTPLSMADVHNQMLSPLTSIRNVSLIRGHPIEFEATQFGCRFLCSLNLDYVVSAEIFEDLLPRLPCLKFVKTYSTLLDWEAAADGDSNCRALEAMRKAVLELPGEALSVSLQVLDVRATNYIPVSRMHNQSAPYGQNAAQLIGIAARVPSLLQMALRCSPGEARMSIAEILADEDIQGAVGHFGGLQVFE